MGGADDRRGGGHHRGSHTLIPLLVLVTAFESVFALHVNVERIGRYLQVFHERAHAGWEHVTMNYARSALRTGLHLRDISQLLPGRARRRKLGGLPRAQGTEPRRFHPRGRSQRFEGLAATVPGSNIAGHSIPHERPIP